MGASEGDVCTHNPPCASPPYYLRARVMGLIYEEELEDEYEETAATRLLSLKGRVWGDRPFLQLLLLQLLLLLLATCKAIKFGGRENQGR
jgi:hypothetical protein